MSTAPITNLWSTNTPARFWACSPQPSPEQWRAAVAQATPLLGLAEPPVGLDELLALVLGEAQFGPAHWRLSPAKQLYYLLKPALPRTLTRWLRRLYSRPGRVAFRLGWPIEQRYAHFQWAVMRRLIELSGRDSITFTNFWPEGRQSALVLTHDIETAAGQAFVRRVADLEQSLGFRSSFNFVPERYPLDRALMDELRARGFEVGVHGLKHDGRLFRSHSAFMRRARRINAYLHDFDAAGFRAPLTHRNPAWMQALAIEYDLSFFDTDPHEPMPGGVMSIWPFMIGRFVELPYTLIQDYTLAAVIGETSPRLWLEKVDFLQRYHGMALVNTHPDYLRDPTTWQIYADFLAAMRDRTQHWRALPRDVAHWWRARAAHADGGALPRATQARAQISGDSITIDLGEEAR